jgi:hypothetical protein
VAALNLGLRFLLELCMLGAYGFSGAAEGALGLLIAVVAIALVAGIWGRFISPKAPRRLVDPARLAVEAVLFGGGALALAATDQPVLAAAFVLVVACNLTLMLVFRQRGM